MIATYEVPERFRADSPEPPALRPTVLVSSRSGAPVPPVAGAVRLAKVLTAAGWDVRPTYALVDVPEGWDRGRLRAYRLASVGVQFMQAGQRGWACWYQVDSQGWRFSRVHLGKRRVGLRELTDWAAGDA
jgi:hypothetical protein